MSAGTDHEGHAPHPFFHTMVVMGSALAIGCGGLSDSVEPEHTASGAGGGGSGGGGSSGGSGGTGSSGGSGSTAGTMSNGTGGSLVIIQGGTGGEEPVEPGPFTCSPAQWVCASSYPACHGEGFRLPEGCMCDESRPTTPADCAAGENLVCRFATATSDGRLLTEQVLFSCACSKAESSCEVSCDLVFPDGGNCFNQLEGKGGTSVLCGCAVIVLR